MTSLLLKRAERQRGSWRGRSGVAVIEFALTAPILITMLLGIADLTPALMVKFKVGTATQAVADLATQAATMQPSDIANDFAIGGDVMTPFSNATLILRITNIASDGNGNALVYWSCGQSTTMPPLDARKYITSTTTPALAPNLISTAKNGLNTSYVMVEAQYTFTPPAGFILRSPQITKVVAYTLPRVSTYIGPTYGDPNYVPPAPASTSYGFSIALNGLTCNVAL